MFAPSTEVAPWSGRWQQLARAAGIAPDERLLLALSGGADSVLLLHLLAEARPRPTVVAVHVDHGLRGEESERDARFCEGLARGLGVPYVLERGRLEPGGPSLEARARAARYAALERAARATGHRTILTGHHSDDALETLLWRWVRGTGLAGLRGHHRDLDRGDVRVVRPLSSFRREEVRRILRDRGLRWCEDGSNEDRRFTRNRLRHDFLPFLEEVCGSEGLENLRAFGRAVEDLEEHLAGATAHLAWAPSPHARATRAPGATTLGGRLSRHDLMGLAAPLRRRALWRLLTEGSGRSPGRSLLTRIQDDLAAGRCRRHSLPGGWQLLLRGRELQLLPPPEACPAASAERSPHAGQPPLPFPTPIRLPEPALTLGVPGILTLDDGRRVSAEFVATDGDRGVPRSPERVELDAEGLPESLQVRWPRLGDRFHALGAPGSKPLRRFLADRGVPREERRAVPLVLAGDEILWVVGVEPGERHRLRPTTGARLRLTLHGA